MPYRLSVYSCSCICIPSYLASMVDKWIYESLIKDTTRLINRTCGIILFSESSLKSGGAGKSRLKNRKGHCSTDISGIC